LNPYSNFCLKKKKKEKKKKTVWKKIYVSNLIAERIFFFPEKKRMASKSVHGSCIDFLHVNRRNTFFFEI